MLFNSCFFLFVFLPVFLLVWQTGAISRTPQHVLGIIFLAFSLIFYGSWGIGPLVLLCVMTVLNYAMGEVLARSFKEENAESSKMVIKRKSFFILAIVINLIPLLWFKYSWFIIKNLSLLMNLDIRFIPPGMPVGISFYTFIQIAWLAGIYQRSFKPEGLLRHALFTSCFSYIMSGPIVRYEQTGWQLGQLSGSMAGNLAVGFALFSIGLAKKVILADSLGFYADAVFNGAEKGWPVSCPESWMGSLCYTFQLYFDFSGYTDMALGLGLMVGLRLPENFNSPYKSTGIVEFWRRWHMTLSLWLRDFLYIPLGGNRHGKLRQYLNLFLTMLLGGIWHGAGWTYVAWGAMHGLMLGVNHFYRARVRGSRLEKWHTCMGVRIISILFTFFCLNFCWVVFRAASLDGAITMYKAMFGGFSLLPGQEGNGSVLALDNLFNICAAYNLLFPNNYFSGWQPFALLGLCFVLCWFFPNSHQMIWGQTESRAAWLRWQPTRAWASFLALLSFVSLALLSRQSNFLYFQF